MLDIDEILNNPISWQEWTSSAELLAFLSDLQANILKGHGRDHTANIFVSFDGMTPGDIQKLLQALSFLTTSALDQLRSAEAFKITGVSGGRIVCVFLGRGAYQKLNVASSEMPDNPAFLAGMRERGQLPTLRFKDIPVDFAGLNDPLPDTWEEYGPWAPGKPEPDAMILIADDDGPLVQAGVATISALLTKMNATELGIDRGLAQRRVQLEDDKKGEGIEHFGYVDGRSQPLFLAEDLNGNPVSGSEGEPQTNWNADFPPSQFIVRDPVQSTPFSSGSYFVYRKLEQNVQRFKEQEEQLAAAMGLTGDDAERAGALVVGRFENGTPVVLSDKEIEQRPVNDFNYDGADERDPATTKCPFKAHIRKTNPRGTDEGERSRIMARRGITFGERQDNGPDGGFADGDRPTSGVGLLFMAYMSDISEQFEFTQAAWAGNVNFENADTGIDAVIGQQPNRLGTPDVNWRDGYSGKSADFDFKTSITLIGGDYFFAPSISFLQSGIRDNLGIV